MNVSSLVNRWMSLLTILGLLPMVVGCRSLPPTPPTPAIQIVPVKTGPHLTAASASLLKELGVTSDTPTEMQNGSAADNNLPRVKALIKQGADVNARTLSGYTALMCTLGTDRTDLVSTLLDHGADINGRNNGGETALMMAVEEGQTAMAKLLLKRGANVDAQDQAGCTALWNAAALGKTDMVQLLLNHHINTNLRDNGNRTALAWARTMHPTPTATIVLLQKYGAKE